MFYIRINKVRIFDNREGIFGLFNKAELRFYTYVTASPTGADLQTSALTLSDLANLSDETARKQKLLEAVQTEAVKFAQSNSIEINGVKDNQSLTFGEAGLIIFQSEFIPAALNLQLWVIESDEDIRRFVIDVDQIVDSAAFNGLATAIGLALTVSNPILTAAISVGGVLVHLLREKLRNTKDDLVGYWQCVLNRDEHYPYGVRDKQDVPDTTRNIQVDYTLFGFENELNQSVINHEKRKEE
jgi:hypothetical protein